MVVLSLDPPSLPSALVTAGQTARTLAEDYGWYALFGGVALYFLLRQLSAWGSQRWSASRADEMTVRVRQARLAQQAAWADSQQEQAQHRAPVREMTEDERALHRKYGPKAQQPAPLQEEKLQFDEVFGNLDQDFYRRRKERRLAQGSDSSSSGSHKFTPSSGGGSSSSSSSSGFKPYLKPSKPGGNRRFGINGPSCGPGGCGR